MAKKRILWAVVSSLMAISLILAACGPAAAPASPTAPSKPTSPTTPAVPAAPTTPVQEKPQQEAVTPTGEAPKYGGTLVLAQTSTITEWTEGLNVFWNFLFDTIHDANWTKGPAGGYGSSETDWSSNYDRFDHYVNSAVESYDWKIDSATDTVTIVYHVRRGLRYQVIPGNENSAKVAGREMTADDIAWTLNWQAHTPGLYIYRTVPELRTANITKTGPWEVTVKFPKAATLMPALTNLNGKQCLPRPPEIAINGRFDKWQQQIGTGPFMLQEYIPDSQGIVVKNPNYWGKDPIGPGKGNQLPYLNGVRYLIIPDLSTRMAALRTAKIDQLHEVGWDDAAFTRKTTPALKEFKHYSWNTIYPSIHLKVDASPFNDIRARQAIMYATDFKALRQGLFGGEGIIQTRPFVYNKAYADLWIAEDDPAMPERVRDLYIYNPDKAKQLLKEAGYPNGFKVDILAASTQVDYLAILKGMWAKVGIEASFMVRDAAVRSSILTAHENPPMTTGGSDSVGRFYQPWSITGVPGTQNISGVNDPVINQGLDKVRTLAITDIVGAMRMMRELLKDHILYQAYSIPAPTVPFTVFWWPWVKNYNGETVMLLGTHSRWTQWIWLDRDLKKSMGY